MEELNKVYIYEKLKHISEEDVRNFNLTKNQIRQYMKNNTYSSQVLSKIALMLKCDFKSLFIIENKIIEE